MDAGKIRKTRQPKKKKRNKRSKEMKKIILKMSEGIFSSLIDILLWNVFYFKEISPLGTPRQLYKASIAADRSFGNFNYLTIRNAIYRARSKGWIKNNLTLTERGISRLESFMPEYFDQEKWNGNWYLVSYDIPEFKRKYRNMLRENLKKLGFGEMHASLWISPFNFLGEVEKIVKDYYLSPYVILSVSDKVGREESKIFAQKIWKLEELNVAYSNLIEKAKTAKKEKLIFEYLAILKKDPQLCKELLPENWLGEKAYLIFENCFPNS